AAVMKFRRGTDQVARHNDLHRLQPHEPRRIVENRADVLGRCGAACISMAEAARILFLQRESRALRAAGRQCQNGADCRRDARTPKRWWGHPLVLLSLSKPRRTQARVVMVLAREMHRRNRQKDYTPATLESLRMRPVSRTGADSSVASMAHPSRTS